MNRGIISSKLEFILNCVDSITDQNKEQYQEVIIDQVNYIRKQLKLHVVVVSEAEFCNCPYCNKQLDKNANTCDDCNKPVW